MNRVQMSSEQALARVLETAARELDISAYDLATSRVVAEDRLAFSGVHEDAMRAIAGAIVGDEDAMLPTSSYADDLRAWIRVYDATVPSP